MTSKSCPSGQIKRKGYVANRRGKSIKVKSSCIKATSIKGVKRSTLDKAQLRKREQIQKKVGSKYGHKQCKPGEMERAGYIRGSYSRKAYNKKNGTNIKATHVRKSTVPPVCIKRRGASAPPGVKKFKIPMVLEKGVLKKAGYEQVTNLSLNDRHSALKRAVNQLKNPLSIYRKLIAVSTLNKNTDPKRSKIFRQDAAWLKEHFGLSKTTSSGGFKTRSKSSSTKHKTSGSKTSKPKSRSKSSKSKSKSSKSKSRSKSRSKSSKPKTHTKGGAKSKSSKSKSRSKTSKPKSKSKSGSKTSKPKSGSKTSRPKSKK